MKTAYFDCIAGASGDMILGAMLDAGLPEQTLRDQLALLNLPDFELNIRRVEKLGFAALKVDVIVADDVPARHLPDIAAIVRQSQLPQSIQDRAIAIFNRLGEVEAKIHNTSLDEVHLHELGGVDTIVDVVGVLCGLDALGVKRVIVSPLPMGRGFVRGAHGQIPLPAPATIALTKGVPIVGSDIDMELVTPTGAALLTSLADGFGAIPAMTLDAIGYGAGGRDLKIPNVLRMMIGQAADTPDTAVETLILLETNIDDLNPEFYDFIMARLFDAGALDVTLSPLQMKKNRPATRLEVLCQPTDAEPLRTIVFTETSTLGIREHTVSRHKLGRSMQTVDTPYGAVRVKIAHLPDGHTRATPEYDDCRRLAEQQKVSLRKVYQVAVQKAQATYFL